MLRIGYLLLALLSLPVSAEGLILLDKERGRSIPVEIYHPARAAQPATDACPVAFLSAGYGVPHTEYKFLAKPLAAAGYLVIAVGHELPGDPALSIEGNLYETRQENWQRGGRTLLFLQNEMKERFKQCNFSDVVLIGHSNGGDISAWHANQGIESVSAVITLDHRRVPLPRNKDIATASIRAGDFAADEGVLPTKEEQEAYGICLINLKAARHNDMTDAGPDWLKAQIAESLLGYIKGSFDCPAPVEAEAPLTRGRS